MPKELPKREMYRCQFCGQDSPARQWKKLKDKCPKCGEEYNVLLAQDSEED